MSVFELFCIQLQLLSVHKIAVCFAMLFSLLISTLVCLVVSASAATQGYLTTNWYPTKDCTGDVVKLNARPANVCINYTIMRTSGQSSGNGYSYTYESYSDNKCTQLKSKATYVQDSACKADNYGLFGKSFYSASLPAYPAKGVWFE